MKIAHIVPLRFLRYTENNDYHMCLAHLVLACHTYADFYAQMAKDGKYVIMDNGAAEGEELLYDDLLGAYDRVNPTEIILPDKLYSRHVTLERTSYFLDNYDLSKYKKMAVPQGSNLIEWEKCCSDFLNIAEIDTIGIPKWLGLTNDQTRPYLCKDLKGINKEVHLLGCSESPSIIRQCRLNNPNVRGCDSAFAYLCAKADIKSIWADTKRPDGTINFLTDEKEGKLKYLMVDFEMEVNK